MKKIGLVLTLLLCFMLSGCVTPYDPYVSSMQDTYNEINRYNENFFSVYRSDLRSWIGKSIQDLEQAFLLRGSSSLDVYGNGTIVYETIFPQTEFSLPHPNPRLIFYVKGNKIYNVVKE